MSTGREGIGEGLDFVSEPSGSSQAQLESAGMVGDSLAVGEAGEKYGIYIQGGQAGSETQTPIVLIDDDKLVHLNWKSHCKRSGLEFSGFMSVSEFLAASSTFDKASRIYIDSNLGDGVKGEIESEKIFALGFLNLYLATGYEKDSIQKPVWIKEIFSKSPENIS